MKKKLGLVLPGKIGDIVICLPIAKYYYDLGYDIYWPVYIELIENFINYVDYVNFLPTQTANRITESFELLNKIGCEQIVDLSFTSPGSWDNENTKNYLSQNLRTFDEFRYYLANVDFNKKWTLKINRDFEKEEKLYYSLVNKSKYALVLKQSSDTVLQKEIDISNYDGQIIEIKPYTKSVFDWLTLIEKAERLLLIESCFNNLIDQLSIKNNKQILMLKHGYYGENLIDGTPKGMPRLRNNWHKI